MIHHTAIVQKNQKIGEGSVIHEYAVVRDNVTIGNNVIIHPHVVIEMGVEIEDGVEIFPGAYIGKEPKGAGVLARQPTYNKKIIIRKNSSIGPHAIIFYDVEIGENTLVGDGASIREKSYIGANCLISRYVTINYNARIGDRVKIMDLTHITGNTIIGNDVFISTMVGTTNDNYIGRLRSDEQRLIGPIIDDCASIGAGATLLPGVRIGRGALVGAGAVVSKDVEEYVVVMGVPARFVRNFTSNDKVQV